MSQEMLSAITDTLRAQYLNHEITPDAYAASLEDVKLCERRIAR